MSDDANACARCGAPRDGDEGARCRFCGATRETGPTRHAAVPSAPRRASVAAFGGSVFMAAFGVLWTVTALNIGAPAPFALFGLLFAGFALYVGFAARRQGGASNAGDDADEGAHEGADEDTPRR
jgi:hypothetical protein